MLSELKSLTIYAQRYFHNYIEIVNDIHKIWTSGMLIFFKYNLKKMLNIYEINNYLISC